MKLQRSKIIKNQKSYNDTHIILNWFRIHIMVANPEKCQMFLELGIDSSNITFLVKNKNIKISNQEKLLGITIGDKLTFIKHELYVMAINCLRALTKIKKFSSYKKESIYLSQTYVMSAFKYSPLIWM